LKTWRVARAHSGSRTVDEDTGKKANCCVYKMSGRRLGEIADKLGREIETKNTW